MVKKRTNSNLVKKGSIVKKGSTIKKGSVVKTTLSKKEKGKILKKIKNDLNRNNSKFKKDKDAVMNCQEKNCNTLDLIEMKKCIMEKCKKELYKYTKKILTTNPL